MLDIIGTIIFGAIIGALARLFMRGRQPIGIIWTIIVGIIAALIGYWLAGLIGVEDTDGIDWIRWAISILVAIVGVSIVMGVTSGRRRV